MTHSNVNLRNGPGTSFTVVTLIPAGASVEVHECKNGWCEASFQGQNGYIIQSSIAPGASAARARPRPAPGYYAGPPPGYDEPPPGYYPPPPPAYGYYGYPYGRPYWGWRRGYWRRW
ncbi:MAG TPA: SH3 domain-containing protein [Xanthobacteraceae bacterium]|nr:SH3 domain-containing protein [Xanthobacteraceae bacterium]